MVRGKSPPMTLRPTSRVLNSNTLVPSRLSAARSRPRRRAPPCTVLVFIVRHCVRPPLLPACLRRRARSAGRARAHHVTHATDNVLRPSAPLLRCCAARSDTLTPWFTYAATRVYPLEWVVPAFECCRASRVSCASASARPSRWLRRQHLTRTQAIALASRGSYETHGTRAKEGWDGGKGLDARCLAGLRSSPAALFRPGGRATCTRDGCAYVRKCLQFFAVLAAPMVEKRAPQGVVVPRGPATDRMSCSRGQHPARGSGNTLRLAQVGVTVSCVPLMSSMHRPRASPPPARAAWHPRSTNGINGTS